MIRKHNDTKNSILGLTIIELLITVTLMAVGFVVLVAALKIFFGVWDDTYSRTATQDRMRSALAILYDDIKHAEEITSTNQQEFFLQLRRSDLAGAGEKLTTISYYLFPAGDAVKTNIIKLSGNYDTTRRWNGGNVILRDISSKGTRIDIDTATNLIKVIIATAAKPAPVELSITAKPVQVKRI